MYPEPLELYLKCLAKLDQALSMSDYDLRIVTGHSNMLGELMETFGLHTAHETDSKYELPEISGLDCESDLIILQNPTDSSPASTKGS